MIKTPLQLSSGSLTLDLALGPIHRSAEGIWQHGFAGAPTVEIIGPESSGKTMLALHVIAAAQKKEGTQPSSTPRTLSTRPGPVAVAWSWAACCSRSPATASRRCKSPMTY
jgi:RecA/RadA recombinase